MTTTADPDGFDLVETTVAEVHGAMETGEVTAVELVDRYLARIDAYDADLNAILRVNPEARDRAAELDAAFESEGFVGPLHGIPVLLKDNHDTADLPTTAGSVALADSVPDRDAEVVRRIRAAGAVVLAKANLQEFSFGVDTISSLGGETKNAYDLQHRPSGSSGGTAAAIAANLGVLGTGSDTCSSVRSPPAFNNLVGVRPTRGLVSRRGIVPLSETQDTAGPITRTVADAARLLDVMVGYDPEDPVTATGVGKAPAKGYVDHLDGNGLEGARIGVVRQFFEVEDPQSADPSVVEQVTDVVDAAIDEMAAAGAEVIDPVEVMDPARIGSARVLQFEFVRDFDAYLAGLDDVTWTSLHEIIYSGTVADAIEERIRESTILETDVASLPDNREYLMRLERRREIAVDTERRMVDQNLDA
ncbi:MAG: amidase family protein, partial [Halobacteriales archaeon]|nr:amidase family protein [Halobacteriales archaeon]